ncbi:hypothetical protein RRG08_066925 [Elysia crispata]|uniref:Uncharacterized protein n=1 Tax=Elysia crispata TaxID=231223 RepID=A0AAE1ANT8_9GAST|nr:hypothetical protein RRG08_066925 [Elysia crispata]
MASCTTVLAHIQVGGDAGPAGHCVVDPESRVLYCFMEHPHSPSHFLYFNTYFKNFVSFYYPFFTEGIRLKSKRDGSLDTEWLAAVSNRVGLEEVSGPPSSRAMTSAHVAHCTAARSAPLATDPWVEHPADPQALSSVLQVASQTGLLGDFSGWYNRLQVASQTGLLGDFSGWINRLQVSSQTGLLGDYSGWIIRLQVSSQTGLLGDFSGWINKLQVSSQTGLLRDYSGWINRLQVSSQTGLLGDYSGWINRLQVSSQTDITVCRDLPPELVRDAQHQTACGISTSITLGTSDLSRPSVTACRGELRPDGAGSTRPVICRCPTGAGVTGAPGGC